MKTIALIPARSGSKGVIDKNIRQINGKSLIQYAIDYAMENSWIDEVFISTDSTFYEHQAIEGGAKSLGLRASYLSADNARTLDVCKNFINECKQAFIDIDCLVLLQPSSPIRPDISFSDIDSLFNAKGYNTITSVAKVEEPHPYKMLTLNQEGSIQPLFEFEHLGMPRQSLPTCYMLTGSIYIWKCATLLASSTNFPLPVSYIEQKKFVNIDTEDDIETAKKILR